jgi:hypothetical protein
MLILSLFLAWCLPHASDGIASTNCYSNVHGGFTREQWPHCVQIAENTNIQVYSGKTADGNFVKLGMHVIGHSGAWSSLATAGNGGMKGARMIVVRKKSGEWVAEDRYSQDYAEPQLHNDQDVKLLFAQEESGGTSWGVLLPLDACKTAVNGLETDYPLSEDVYRWMLFALGSTHDFAYHGSTRGQFHANLISGSPQKRIMPANAEELDLNMPNVDISSSGGKDDTNPYICASFDLSKVMPSRDWNSKHHAIKFAPLIQSKYVHHIILYACDTQRGFSRPVINT